MDKFSFDNPNRPPRPSQEKIPTVEESRLEKENLLAQQATAIVERWGRLDDRKREWFYKETWKELRPLPIWEHYRNLGLKFDNPVEGIDFSIPDKPRVIPKGYMQRGAASYNPQRKEIGLPSIQQDPRLDLIMQAHFFGSPLPMNRPFILNGKMVAETFPLRISRIAHELTHHYQYYPDHKEKNPRQIQDPNELIFNEVQALSAQYPAFSLPDHSGKALVQIAQAYHEQHFQFSADFNSQIVDNMNQGLTAARAMGKKERDICLELASLGNFEKQLEFLNQGQNVGSGQVSGYLESIRKLETETRNAVKDTVQRHVPTLGK